MIKSKSIANIVLLGLMSVSTMGFTSDNVIKRMLKSNMIETYKVLPQEVENISDMLANGVFYGRLRSNFFLSDKGENHYVYGVGGSFIYKSAYLSGFGFTAGLYTTQNPWHMEDKDAVLYKAGKGTLNRHDVLTEGKYGITSLAQSYIEYRNEVLSIKAGRLIYESFLTKSNDTKMIPNTFEGITFNTNLIANTKVRAAYLTKQKLRDHSEFHHLLAYDDTPNDLYANYTQNDDSAMHQGLSLTALKTKDIDDELITFEVKSSAIENLALTFNYTGIPHLISSSMIQADYRFDVGGMRIKPSLRYMKQFDDGAGEIGGANLKQNTFGYNAKNNLDGTLYGTRIDLLQKQWRLRFGYTEIADEGDLIAPWRGFPTGGFSRTMAQYNWYANTKTYMMRADYSFPKTGIISGLKAMVRYAIQDFDDNKAGVQADSNVLTLDIIKKFDTVDGLYMKTRMAYVDGDENTIAGDGSLKDDSSYNEFRFEINYLF